MAAMEKHDRLHIVNAQDGSSIPFLRGILTRSLQKAGLVFEDAYSVASDIRRELKVTNNLSSSDLRASVGEHLRKNGYEQFEKSYMEAGLDYGQLKVVTAGGNDSPFSKGQLADSLEICALPREALYEVATAIESKLMSQGRLEVSTMEITENVLRLLHDMEGANVSESYKRWVEFSHKGRPLIILIGGTAGCGKSSVSSELAHRLDIVRTQSTDMLREVMRLLVPERLIPTLHTSSFEAYAGLPTVEAEATAVDVVNGYLTQSSQVALGVEGVLNRTHNEQVSTIVEGVHLHPQLMSQIAKDTDAFVVPVILAVLKSQQLKKRLQGRGQAIKSRKSERYMEKFDQIWDLQSFLLSQADEYDIPIIENNDEEITVRMILQTVSSYLKSEMQVFG